MKVIFFPSLYCKSNELFDLFLLNDTLDFIINYLDAELDDYNNVFYNDDRLFMPPIMEHTNEILQYYKITTNLYKLKANGENIIIASSGHKYDLYDNNFNVVSDSEFQNIVDYLHQLSLDGKLCDVLMFTDDVTDSDKFTNIEIEIDGTVYTIPFVGNPMLDESGNFNSYIKSDVGCEYKIFKSRDICTELVKKVENKCVSGRNGALYKHYGKVIALRNEFEFYHPKKPYDKNTYYFISKDRQYIISIDLKHGHYEIFDNHNQQLWIAKYKFSGDVISEPTDLEILKKERKTHKVEE